METAEIVFTGWRRWTSDSGRLFEFFWQFEWLGGLSVSRKIKGRVLVPFPQAPAASARTASVSIAGGADRASNFTIRFPFTTSAVNRAWASTLGFLETL